MTFKASALCAFAGFLAVSCAEDKTEVVPSGDNGAEMTFNTTSSDWKNIQQNKPKALYGKIGKLQTTDGNTLYMRAVSVERPDPEISYAPQTRGGIVTADNMYPTIQVSAYKYQGAWNNNLRPEYFHNQTFGITPNNPFYGSTGATKYKWPGSSYKMQFFAYTPKFDLATPVVIMSPTSDDPFYLRFKSPLRVEDQKDFLVAYSDEVPGNYERPVPLKFKHALTALRFVARNLKPGVIKSITLKGVFANRRYDIHKRAWVDPIVDKTPESKEELFFAARNGSFTLNTEMEITGELDQVINPDHLFLFPPLTLPRNDITKIEIVYQQKGSPTPQKLTASVMKLTPEWHMGNIITFYIASSTSLLNVSSNLGDWTHGGDL